jgi:hypothetical protein
MKMEQFYLTTVPPIVIGIVTGILGAMAATFFLNRKKEWLRKLGSWVSVCLSLEFGIYLCSLVPIKADYVQSSHWIFLPVWLGSVIMAAAMADFRSQAQAKDRRSSDNDH